MVFFAISNAPKEWYPMEFFVRKHDGREFVLKVRSNMLVSSANNNLSSRHGPGSLLCDPDTNQPFDGNVTFGKIFKGSKSLKLGMYDATTHTLRVW